MFSMRKYWHFPSKVSILKADVPANTEMSVEEVKIIKNVFLLSLGQCRQIWKIFLNRIFEFLPENLNDYYCCSNKHSVNNNNNKNIQNILVRIWRFWLKYSRNLARQSGIYKNHWLLLVGQWNQARENRSIFLYIYILYITFTLW